MPRQPNRAHACVCLLTLLLWSLWPIAHAADASLESIYLGKHLLGSNRITFDERVGTAEFSKRNGKLYLTGRVERGGFWLELQGTVELESPLVFHMDGEIRGIPGMLLEDEKPRQRSSAGRFTFKVRNNRKFWRLYLVDGKDCVCGDECGNDFCYIDIERAVLAAGAKP